MANKETPRDAIGVPVEVLHKVGGRVMPRAHARRVQVLPPVRPRDDYAERTAANAKAAGIDFPDALCLAGIELACAVADARCDERGCLGIADGESDHFDDPFYVALDRLEAATRGSALRKVRP